MVFDFNSLDHTFFMGEALKEAALAGEAGERPIGAVIVHRGQIVGRGRAEHRPAAQPHCPCRVECPARHCGAALRFPPRGRGAVYHRGTLRDVPGGDRDERRGSTMSSSPWQTAGSIPPGCWKCPTFSATFFITLAGCWSRRASPCGRSSIPRELALLRTGVHG